MHSGTKPSFNFHVLCDVHEPLFRNFNHQLYKFLMAQLFSILKIIEILNLLCYCNLFPQVSSFTRLNRIWKLSVSITGNGSSYDFYHKTCS